MPLSGLLLIDKPCGPTSHDVVSSVRKLLRERRVGHAGTLDPEASGLLLVCVGDATRLLEYMTADSKAYTGEIVVGIGTDTDDAVGEVIATGSAAHLTADDLVRAASHFTGEFEQTVPRYSAVHIDGRRAYDLARTGQSFDLPARRVEVSEFQISDVRREGDCLRAAFAVACSKGTYIRALCRDVGEWLGVPAHMASLRRVRSGSVSVESAVPLEVLMSDPHPEAFLHNPLLALTHLQRIDVDVDQVKRLAMGQVTEAPAQARLGDAIAVHAGSVAAVVRIEKRAGTAVIKPRKVLWKRGAPDARDSN